jgi:phage shock protein C
MNNRSFHLDKSNSKLMGVCSGIANYFDWDVNLIRIAFVLAALFGIGAPVLIYLVIGLIASDR